MFNQWMSSNFGATKLQQSWIFFKIQQFVLAASKTWAFWLKQTVIPFFHPFSCHWLILVAPCAPNTPYPSFSVVIRRLLSVMAVTVSSTKPHPCVVATRSVGRCPWWFWHPWVQKNGSNEASLYGLREKYPIGSMGLVYLPTFTIKIKHSCR